jgi:hypothetical protein
MIDVAFKGRNERKQQQRQVSGDEQSTAMRVRIIERDNSTCKRKLPFEEVTLEHLVPRSRGGKTTENGARNCLTGWPAFLHLVGQSSIFSPAASAICRAFAGFDLKVLPGSVRLMGGFAGALAVFPSPHFGHFRPLSKIKGVLQIGHLLISISFQVTI